MDLLKTMMTNRQATMVTPAVQPVGMKPSSIGMGIQKQATPGTRAYRRYIVEEKPGKKVVREHFEALVERVCASSDEDDSELE